MKTPFRPSKFIGRYSNSNDMAPNNIAFCLAEDRADLEIGLRLAILSLSKHCPGTPIFVYRPLLVPQFAEWVRQFPQVRWFPHAPEGANSWNCKPQALKPVLADGYGSVIWLDSDMIVTRDCRPLFKNLDDDTLAVAQEPASLPFRGTAIRTRAWKLEVGRALPFTLNSSVLRVTKRHAALLERWIECLADPRYLASQSKSLEERPIHMASDQDILNALIGSADFAETPVHVFRSAVDIIHAGGALGYSWKERLRGLSKPKPTFLHATAGKPWLWLGGAPYWSQRTFFSWHRRLLQETSPYLFEARRYRSQLAENTRWMEKRTGMGTLLRLLGFGHFALRGLPLSMVADATDAMKRISRPTSQANANPPDGDVPIFGQRP
jgi:hypothetical protein